MGLGGTGRSHGVAMLGVWLIACAPSQETDSEASSSPISTPQSVPSGPVVAGVDVLLRDSLHLVRGRRVGLITNHTGVSSFVGASDAILSSVDVLHSHDELELVALYSPEHGLSGQSEAGEKAPSGRHERTGLPIYSLYGEISEPVPHMLEGVDVLLFDIQGVGARYYTYRVDDGARHAGGKRGQRNLRRAGPAQPDRR